MNKRIFLILQAILNSVLTIFAISLPFWADVPNQIGLIMAAALALIFGFMAFNNVRQLQHTREEERVFAPDLDATAEEEAAFYKRMIYLALAAFPALMLITIMDLNDLEGGIVEHVRLWVPIAFLYNHFGYWVTILSIPLAGMIAVFLLFRRWQSSDNEEEGLVR